MVKETIATQLSAQLLYQKDIALQNSRGQLAFFSRPRGLQRQHSFVWCRPAAATTAALDCQANQNARSRCSRPSQTPATPRKKKGKKRKNTPPVTADHYRLCPKLASGRPNILSFAVPVWRNPHSVPRHLPSAGAAQALAAHGQLSQSCWATRTWARKTAAVRRKMPQGQASVKKTSKPSPLLCQHSLNTGMMNDASS